MNFETGDYKFELYSKDGFDFLAVKDKDYPPRISNSFFTKIQKRFAMKFTADIRSQLIKTLKKCPNSLPSLRNGQPKRS